MTVQDDGLCIYCKQQGSSKEHVAPSSLGGNCTLNCVCVKCNGDLSEVDQALAEHSPVALSKIQHTPPSASPTQLGNYASMQTYSAVISAIIQTMTCYSTQASVFQSPLRMLGSRAKSYGSRSHTGGTSRVP